MAPEIARYPPINVPFLIKPTDIFSLGQTWYKLLVGKTLTGEIAARSPRDRREIESRPARMSTVRDAPMLTRECGIRRGDREG